MSRPLQPLIFVAALLSQGCEGETEVRVHFDAFSCPGLPVGAKSLGVHVGERASSGGREVLRSTGQHECINKPVAFTPQALAGLFAERGYLVKDVSADKETRAVLFLSIEADCKGPLVVCLLSDPVLPGGEAQRVAMRGICGPTGGPAPPGWPLCGTVLAP